MSTYTLHDCSRDWVLHDTRAPEEVADAYAAHVVAEDADGAYGELGAHHPSEWIEWSHRNLSECTECGSPWVLRCDEGWYCTYCGDTFPFETGEE